MNSSDICHQVEDCPGLYVDAFKGHFLREHTKNPNATFVLSHYHGDHYTQLPRDFKYKGPAKIHCTHITARLLIDVHLVSKDLVVEHDYGVTFCHNIEKPSNQDAHANITFYDANHCPGACIILIELPKSKTVHLHTGDMRYHPRFQSYPLLANATRQRKLDLVYLDTTYCHPKHDFLAQNDAVDTIAAQTQQLLLSESTKTLVLLSCYSIGKEKVLYEASKRSNQPIYVSEKKWKMLNCIQQQQQQPDDGSAPEKEDHQSTMAEHEQHISILEKCTRDPSESDLHVIPMGLAGEMWPYFQPNFQKLAKYVQDLGHNNSEANETEDQSPKEYDRVVAFIPTGWADATNWNKKNAISTKTVPLKTRSLHVEVRLISYSEHSTFSELVSFVQYLKPRKVIPTVYSDANHKRQIEGRFRNMLDSNRAKQAFFRSMTKKSSSAVAVSPANKNDLVPSCSTEVVEGKKVHAKTCSNGSSTANNSNSTPRAQVQLHEYSTDAADEIEVLRVVPSTKSPSDTKDSHIHSDKVDTLVNMGFDRHLAQAVLKKCHGNVERAIHEILSETTTTAISTTTNKDSIRKENAKQGKSHQSQLRNAAGDAAIKKRKISDFFGQKKK